MDLDELRAFLAVVDHGSFSGAAKALGFARPTLQRRVGELEARTGAELVRVGPRGTIITTAGVRMAERARRVLAQADDLIDSARGIAADGRPLIEYIQPPGIPVEPMARVFGLLTSLLPSLRFHVRVATDPVRALTESGDVAVYMGDRPEPGPYSVHPVSKADLGLFASETYAAKEGLPATLAEVQERRLAVWMPQNRSPRELPLRAGGALEVEPTIIFDEPYLPRAFIDGTRMLGFFARAGVNPEFDPIAVVQVLPHLIGADVGVWMLVAHRSRPSDLAHNVAAAFARAVAELVFTED